MTRATAKPRCAALAALALSCASAATPVPPACAICHTAGYTFEGVAMPDGCKRCHEPIQFHRVLGSKPDPTVTEWWVLHRVEGR